MFNIDRFYLQSCIMKRDIADVRHGRRDMLLLRNRSLQDAIDISYGLGTPIAWEENRADRDIIRNIEPHKEYADTQSAYGAAILDWHTENVSHLRTPNFVILFCERKDRRNEGLTLLSHIDDIKEELSMEDINTLKSNKFSLSIEDTLLMDEGDRYLGHTSIFKDNDMYYDSIFMTPNDDASSAFDHLRNAIDKCKISILLEPGDILIFNNTRYVHSRTAFHPNYDGNDRLLKRILILNTYNIKCAFSGYQEYVVPHHISDMIPTDNSIMRNLAHHQAIEQKQHKSVCIMQVAGGTDKQDHPHRREIKYLVKSFRDHDIRVEIVFYRDDDIDLIDYICMNFDICMTRINPEEYPSYTESRFLKTLRMIEKNGVRCLPSADTISILDSKDIVYHIRDTIFGLSNTKLYTDKEQFIRTFSLGISERRVLKVQHQAEGRGIYCVSNTDVIEANSGVTTPMDIISLSDRLFSQGGHVLDQQFLPRIKEAEIRIILVGYTPLYVVLFIPSGDEWLASADGKYHHIDIFPNLKERLQGWIPQLIAIAGCDIPLLWSADFIMYGEYTGKDPIDCIDFDRMILSEINCSCLGFKQNEQQPDLSQYISEYV